MPAQTKKPQPYVALLRGINVGGNCRVEMRRLKTMCEELGYTQVQTYINSGNVILYSEKSPKAILREFEPALEAEFGFRIPTILRSKKDLLAIEAFVPKKWTNDTEQRTDVLFLWDQVDTPQSLQRIVTTPKVDELRYTPGAIIWHLYRRYYTKSSMHKFIGTPIYKQMTARNINTVRTLAQLMSTT